MSDTASDTLEPTPAPASMFMQIPLDIRELIYRYTLVANQAIDWPVDSFNHNLAPALLQTCKQIYDEATPVLYRYNRFTFCHPSDCNVFRWIMDNKYVSQISNVAFRIRDKDLRLWTAYLGSTDRIRSLTADLPNLQSLVVFLRQNGWSFGVDPDEAFKHWDRNQRLRQLCMSLERHSAATNVTVVCSMRITEHHFEHLKMTQAAQLVVHGEYARTTRAVEMFSSMAVLELLSPKASCSEKNRIIGL